MFTLKYFKSIFYSQYFYFVTLVIKRVERTSLLMVDQNERVLVLLIVNVLLFSFHNEGGAAAYQQYPVCQGKQLTCSNNILNRMGEFNQVEISCLSKSGSKAKKGCILFEFSKVEDIIENKTKLCLANCEDQINDLFVTTSNYPNKKTFKEREEYCLLVKKLVRSDFFGLLKLDLYDFCKIYV